MMILISRLHRATSLLESRLTKMQKQSIYIHLKDHHKKINPDDTKIPLSYMNPTHQTDITPEHQEFRSKLNKKIQKDLDKKIFEDYKLKLLEGQVDEEEVVEPDPLWGDSDKPIHYYKNLSHTQATWVSHSEYIDLSDFRQSLIDSYFKVENQSLTFESCQTENDLARLAANLRLQSNLDRSLFYQIEQKIGNKFHKLSNESLILLKFGFQQSPKQGTPEFNKILNDLLIECLPELSKDELINLFYANRHDGFRMYEGNLQWEILKRLDKFVAEMTVEQKINWLFLYIDCRAPIIRKRAQDRHWNEIRNQAQGTIFKLDLPRDLSTCKEEHVLKLAYSLVRSKANMTDHISDSIAEYVEQAIEKQSLSSRGAILFFIYLSEINGGKSIQNQQLLKVLKDVVLTCWEEYEKVYKVRSLVNMMNLNLYDEAVHEVYTNLEMEADNTLLGYFCQLQLMNSSGREWQVIHLMAELEELPLKFFQHYKRFYNYVRATAPDWDLEPIQKKLQNTEPYFNSQRFESSSMDKRLYSNIKNFLKFSDRNILPSNNFKLGAPIRNIEFADFVIQEYQIAIDIVCERDLIPGTRDLRASFLAKTKSLECIGWKHLYVFEDDISSLNPISFFSYLTEMSEPYFQEQVQVMLGENEYKSSQIEHIKNARYWKLMSGPELEKLMNDPEGKLEEDEQNMQATMPTNEDDGYIEIMSPEAYADYKRQFLKK